MEDKMDEGTGFRLRRGGAETAVLTVGDLIKERCGNCNNYREAKCRREPATLFLDIKPDDYCEWFQTSKAAVQKASGKIEKIKDEGTLKE